MNVIGHQVVATARSWIGTPYCHQASIKGAGTDCLGLIRGVWRELYGCEPEPVPAYTPDWSEASRSELLWQRAQAHLIPVACDEEARGDVILFRMRDGAVAKHLGIAAVRAGVDTFIHAYSGHAVTESALSAPWARRVVARFRFPERSV